MSHSRCDLAIVGGGLAGGLIALAVAQRRPDLSLQLIEAGESLGGNHRWSWFDGDLLPAEERLVAGFHKTEWDGGNRVRFPGYERQLQAGYRSLDSRDFDGGLRGALPQGAIRTGIPATDLHRDGVTLASGETIEAGRVIDCRDAVPSRHLAGGWQVFLGQTIRTARPHGLDCPLIMDGRVDQPGAYRFVYALPLGDNEVFVEDTYYADLPTLNRDLLRRRITDYARSHGWEGAVVHEETGVLPVISGGDFASYRRDLAIDGVALAGARGGFVHPLTSYTIPIAARAAVAIAQWADLPGPDIAARVDAMAKAHWRATGFYRLLGKMLFGAAHPEERWRIFARFYRLPEPLIERFYAARSTTSDKIRVLSGKPPVPVPSALRALLGKGAPLVQEDRA